MSEKQTKRARREARKIVARNLRLKPTRAQVKRLERIIRSNLRRSKP